MTTIYNKKGFTLVELLIVIAIIAILAAIAIPAFNKYRNRAFNAEIQSDANNAFASAQLYLSDNPGATVNSELKLLSGGARLSKNTTWVSGDMTIYSGNIKLTNVAAEDDYNQSTILANGQITFY